MIAEGGAVLREAVLHDPLEAQRIEQFVASRKGTLFQRPAWLFGVEQGTGQTARGLLLERNGEVAAWLPVSEVHSPIFGRMLASSGFAVGGGVLGKEADAIILCRAAEILAERLSCPTIELRGGTAPKNWSWRRESHCGFVRLLATDNEAQLMAIPRKQRAEIRKSLKIDLQITIGTEEEDRAAHYAVYAESVHNLGTPVFPRSLFDAMLARLDSDVLTVWHEGVPVASVLSFYHDGAVMPYWGGGTYAARRLRANDRMYFELMCHARERGCERFDFGRSKTQSGPYFFKRNWGFEPQSLAYASWTAPGEKARNADPTSKRHAARIALWKKLPLPIANRLGPWIARGLG
ncbi:FemAB family PEP-CTERM system-associated protein [Altericroceibacterium spongiae]|uniref:FemAB family PEP-CTERM system-associated protein n=1 Tax=Altericroceibacterium spongiae TaxID=2320269 RepID=A0A420ES87_9SPHN|nr:FemAB family XrtA/PEP-CTERM system-associated protein [Altericroceibacterium spongiae]RKF23584.1 FemAB family PEP-CTERM system-associated protein [Altericroceibacterium spongiae]